MIQRRRPCCCQPLRLDVALRFSSPGHFVCGSCGLLCCGRGQKCTQRLVKTSPSGCLCVFGPQPGTRGWTTGENMSTTIGTASAEVQENVCVPVAMSTSRTEGYHRGAGKPGANHPCPPPGRSRMFTRKQPTRDWQHCTVYVPCSNQGACSASTGEQCSIVFALCNQLQRDRIGPDFDRRAVVQNHTREMPAPRFRPCDITQCELDPSSVDCQPGSVLGTSSSTHQTVVSPCLDARRQCH